MIKQEKLKRRILILHSSSDLYGASKILVSSIQFLTAEGHTLFAALSDEGRLADAMRQLGVDVRICRLGILRRKYFNPKGIINRLAVLRNARKELGKLVIDEKIDLIYTNTTAVLVGAIIAKNHNIKHIWHVQEIITKPLFFVKFIGYFLNTKSTKIIAVSNAVKTHWSKYLTHDLDKIQTIYSSIDYTPYLTDHSDLRKELDYSDDIVIVGMIGRVHYWKGQDYFLQIAGAIAKKYPKVRFVMVGDVYPGYEYLYQKINEIKKEEGIEHLVKDLGFRTDVANIMHGFDIFVSPSVLPDPFPTVILEAMASGRPVVATNHGGAVEMVDDNKSGVLIPLNNALKAESLMANLITDRTLRLEMGKKSRERVLDLFSTEKYGKDFINLVNSI